MLSMLCVFVDSKFGFKFGRFEFVPLSLFDGGCDGGVGFVCAVKQGQRGVF